jgi:hypothetical protein
MATTIVKFLGIVFVVVGGFMGKSPAENINPGV